MVFLTFPPTCTLQPQHLLLLQAEASCTLSGLQEMADCTQDSIADLRAVRDGAGRHAMVPHQVVQLQCLAGLTRTLPPVLQEMEARFAALEKR